MCKSPHPKPPPGRLYVVWLGDVPFPVVLPCGCAVVPRERRPRASDAVPPLR